MTIWLISNIIYENDDEKNKIINSKLFPKITDLINQRATDITLMRMIIDFFKNLLHKKNYDKIKESFVLYL